MPPTLNRPKEADRDSPAARNPQSDSENHFLSRLPSLFGEKWLAVVTVLASSVFGVAIGEAMVVFYYAGVAGISFAGRLSGLWISFGLLMLPFFLLIPLGGLLLTRPSVVRLGRGLCQSLGGKTGNPTITIFFTCLVLAATAVLGVALGSKFYRSMSPRFALAATVIATLLFLVLLLPFTALASTGLDAATQTLRRFRIGKLLVHPASVVLLLSLTLLIVLRALLPPPYAVAPVVGLIFLAVGLASWTQRMVGRLTQKWKSMVGVALFVVCAPTPFICEVIHPNLQEVLLYRPPYLSLALGYAHKLMDHDGDGYAPVLMGGDCDDDNARIHPTAREIPGNGIDEDCSGFDAKPYKPPEEPPYVRPQLPKRMNIVLIHVECLRADRTGFAGAYHRNTTPNMDLFAKNATVFKRAYTPAPMTHYAMASLFTGLDPLQIPNKKMGGTGSRLLPEAKTLAEMLRRVGYDTFGQTISYVIHHDKGMGQGFRVWKTPWPTNDWKKIYGKASRLTTNAAIRYLEGRKSNKPWLMFLHYRFGHHPYIKHKPWDFGNSASDRYDSAIAYGDHDINRLLETLQSRSDWDRTAVIIFGDHGEAFGDHGFTNHGNSLYDSEVHVALLIRVPNAPLNRTNVPVRLTDIAPTVLDLASVKRPGKLDGWSLLPLMFESSPKKAWGKRPLYLYTNVRRGSVRYHAVAVLRWPYKAIRNRVTSHMRLYDVAKDPAEKHDLITKKPTVARKLNALLESWLARPSYKHRTKRKHRRKKKRRRVRKARRNNKLTGPRASRRPDGKARGGQIH